MSVQLWESMLIRYNVRRNQLLIRAAAACLLSFNQSIKLIKYHESIISNMAQLRSAGFSVDSNRWCASPY